MSDNLDIVLSHLQHMAKGNIDAAMAHVADNGIIQGPDGTVMTKAGLIDIYNSVAPMFAGEFTQNIVGITEQDNRIAVEMTMSVPLTNGKVYSNIYHFLFELADGRIVRMAEYCNIRATEVFG